MYLINCQLHDFEVGFTKVICSSNPLRCQAASGVQKDREEIKPHNEEHELILLSPFLPSLRLWEPDTAPGIQQCYGTCAWIYPHKHTVAGSWAVTTHFQMGHKQRQKSVISCTTWNSDSQKNSHFWNYGLTHFCELLRMKKPGAHVAAEARQPGSKLSNFERFA